MNTITIPKKLIQHDDLMIVPRKEFEALLELNRGGTFKPTLSERKALMVAERNLKRGKPFSFNELVRQLGFTN